MAEKRSECPRLAPIAGARGSRLAYSSRGEIGTISLMRKVVVDFDEQTFKRLEQVASDSSSRRSDFIRGAVRRALWELEEGTSFSDAAKGIKRTDKRAPRSKRRG
jgi:hypothetical protein